MKFTNMDQIAITNYNQHPENTTPLLSTSVIFSMQNTNKFQNLFEKGIIISLFQ
jgi:hypothetical protein